jgi:hypothetical protein
MGPICQTSFWCFFYFFFCKKEKFIGKQNIKRERRKQACSRNRPANRENERRTREALVTGYSDREREREGEGRGRGEGDEGREMWEAICMTLIATSGNNIGKVLQKKGTLVLPPLSFKLKVPSLFYFSHLYICDLT